MAAVPVTIQCIVYPRNKTAPPFPATIVGLASITGLEIGGGPIIPDPPDLPVEPPLEIWPNPPEGTAPIPGHPIVLPGDPGWEGPDVPPPEEVPPAVTPPHPGWNWSAALGQWVWVYIPGQGVGQPKT